MLQADWFDVFLRFFQVIILKKRMILSITFLSTVVAIVSVFMAKSTYRAEAIIKPPSSSGSSSALQAALQSAGGGFLGSILGESDNGLNECLSFLHSARFATIVVKRFDLETVYKFKRSGTKQSKYYFADVIKQFGNNAKFSETEENAIQISMDDESAERAQQIVEYMVYSLDSLYTDLQRTATQRRLEYVDGRLGLAESEMKDMENSLVDFQNRHNLIVPEAQVKMILENATQTEIQVETLKEELELEAALRGTGSSHYHDLAVQRDLLQHTLRNRLRNPSDSNSLILPARALPSLATEYLRLERAYTIKLSVYKYLVQQVEALKLDANKDVKVISVIDPPWANEKRVAPRRRIVVEAVFIISFLLSLFLAILQVSWRRYLEQNPESRNIIIGLKSRLFKF